VPTTLDIGKSAPAVAPVPSLGIDTSPSIAAVPPKLLQKITNKEYVDV